MSRFKMQAPAGDEYYPIRVVRAYCRQGDVVVEGDPLFDLQTANGRQLCLRASHGGRAALLFCEAGSIVTGPETLIEIETDSDGLARPAATATPHLPAWDDDVDDEVWEAGKPETKKRDWKKLSIFLLAGICGALLICVVTWFALSYMPLASDGGDTGGYYGGRTGLEPLGGKRRLFNAEEQQERFELWLAS